MKSRGSTSARLNGIAGSKRRRAPGSAGMVASIAILVPILYIGLIPGTMSDTLSSDQMRVLGILITSRSACTRVVSDQNTWRRSLASMSSSTAIASLG